MTPTRLASSQAAMSDIFWDYDTPESRRTRTKIAAQMENLADSPRAKPAETLTQLRLFKPRNKSKTSAAVEDQHVGEVLKDLSKFNAEIFKKEEDKGLSEHEELRPESPIAPKVKKEEIISREETNVEEEEDMFGDSDPFANEPDDFGFDEDENDFLVAATQAAEEDIKPPEATPVPDFGFDEDDSDFLVAATQAAEENIKPPEATPVPVPVKTKMMLPVAAAPEAKPQTTSTSVKVEIPDFGGDDSFEDLLSQMDNAPQVRPSPAPPLHQSQPSGASSNQKPAISLKRNCSSFQSPPSKKIFVQKFQSDSRIEVRNKLPEPKPKCSKDEIERKKREAMERRKVSQSQKRAL